jgi:diadenosine tetraphosphatase ApaH/serine/threonine PP2A family protein phosphatase
MHPAPGSHNFNSMALLYPTASYIPNVGGPQGSFLMWGGFDWRRSTCMINSHFSSLQVSDRPAAPPMQRVATAPLIAPHVSPDVLRPKFDPKTVEILQPLELRAATLALGTSVSLRPSVGGMGLNDDRPAMKKVASIDPSLLATESTARDRPIAKRIIGELLRSSADPRSALQQRRASRPQGKQYDEWIVAKPEELLELCDEAIAVLEKEPTVLRLNAPCKVFGDIHGQLSDLLLLFATFGAPTHHGGDIQLCNYLFLGDYVDRGSHSMEVITLLLALKVTYPDRIFLLRGNHEARQVNSKYTFMAECNERLGYYHGAEVWERFNKVFDYLSLSAIIGGRIFCVHGGLGPDTVSIREIESLSKPISYVEPPFSAQMAPQLVRMNRMLMQLLWCDPADNDSTGGTFGDNPLRTGGNASLGIFKFTSHVVNQFCVANDVDMILRGHQVVQEGVEVFASGRLLTVFSATNYCGVMKNNGAIVLINDRLIISAKTIKCRDADDSQDWVDASMQPPPSPPAWYT